MFILSFVLLKFFEFPDPLLFKILRALLVPKLQHFYKLLGHIIFRLFSSQRHNSLVFAARQIADN